MGGYKAIIGGDAVAINPKYRASYMPHIRAVVQVIHNNLMQQFSDCNNGILRRQIIMPFPEVITSLLLAKVTEELAVIVRTSPANPNDARILLLAQHSSAEVLNINSIPILWSMFVTIWA